MNTQNLLNICNTMRQIENAKKANKSKVLLDFMRKQGKVYLYIWSSLHDF